MIDLGQQLPIIAHEAQIEIMKCCLIAFIALCASLFFAWLYQVCNRELHRFACIVGTVGMAFFGAMTIKATEQGGDKSATPTIKWDVGIKDNGSKYISYGDGGKTNGVLFVWMKTDPSLPDTEALEFMKRSKGSSDEWTAVGTSAVGNLSQDFQIDNADGYEYYVCNNWVPPSPVHTNVVWVGSVVERAKGAVGVEKMVIIHGTLIKDGAKIAPLEVK